MPTASMARCASRLTASSRPGRTLSSMWMWRDIYGTQAMSIFVQPPSIEELERRLRSRNTDSEEQIVQRLGKAEQELAFAPRFDHIVVNDDFLTAVEQTATLVREFVNRP